MTAGVFYPEAPLAKTDLAGAEDTFSRVNKFRVDGDVVEAGMVSWKELLFRRVILSIISYVLVVGWGVQGEETMESRFLLLLGEEVFDDEKSLLFEGGNLSIGDVHNLRLKVKSG